MNGLAPDRCPIPFFSGPLFDLGVVVDYVRLCGQATLAAKVGFFLERHQAALGIPRTVLERLRRMRPKQPHSLDRKLGGRIAPGWNLMVPPALLGGEAGIDP